MSMQSDLVRPLIGRERTVRWPAGTQHANSCSSLHSTSQLVSISPALHAAHLSLNIATGSGAGLSGMQPLPGCSGPIICPSYY